MKKNRISDLIHHNSILTSNKQMVLFLPSATGIATGDAPCVGIHYVAASENHPPFRVYYPAQCSANCRNVGYFEEHSAAFFLQGYWSVLLARQRETLLFRVGRKLLRFASWFLPLNYLTIPGVYRDAPVAAAATTTTTNKPFPLILFSHGLTGTGQENAILLSSWAKQGHVVISVHHTDGSSGRVQLPDGSDLWYDPGPPKSQYDVNFRPRQMEQRVQQLIQARDWLASSKTNDIRSMVDWNKTIVAGFSYGAATTALMAAKKESLLPSLSAVILLDGWFHVDMMESAGIEFEMPQEAFDATATTHLKEIPALFVNSEQFTTYPRLWKATEKLKSQFKKTTGSTSTHHHHVLPQTNHNNFVDLLFWFPELFLRTMGAIGAANARQTYVDLVRLTSDFLKEQRTTN